MCRSWTLSPPEGWNGLDRSPSRLRAGRKRSGPPLKDLGDRGAAADLGPQIPAAPSRARPIGRSELSRHIKNAEWTSWFLLAQQLEACVADAQQFKPPAQTRARTNGLGRLENRDGQSRDCTPPKPPDIRVRIGRFGGLRQHLPAGGVAAGVLKRASAIAPIAGEVRAVWRQTMSFGVQF
jgi:hypothetical protein